MGRSSRNFVESLIRSLWSIQELREYGLRRSSRWLRNSLRHILAQHCTRVLNIYRTFGRHVLGIMAANDCLASWEMMRNPQPFPSARLDMEGRQPEMYGSAEPCIFFSMIAPDEKLGRMPRPRLVTNAYACTKPKWSRG